MPADDRSDRLQGVSHRIMRMTVAAGRHHESLSGMIQNFGPALFNKCFSPFSVTDIDKSSVLYGKRFRNLILIGSEYSAVHNKISTVLFFSGFIHTQMAFSFFLRPVSYNLFYNIP